MEEIEVIAEYNGTDEGYMLFPKRDPLYIVIPITILYSLILLTGVVGNIITCVVIARNRHMHTATNYYLFSLAVSDLLLLVSGLPQEMYYVWSRYLYTLTHKKIANVNKIFSFVSIFIYLFQYLLLSDSIFIYCTFTYYIMIDILFLMHNTS